MEYNLDFFFFNPNFLKVAEIIANKQSKMQQNKNVIAVLIIKCFLAFIYVEVKDPIYTQ